MRRLIAVIMMVLVTGCASNPFNVKKEVQLVETPVPFCPAPPEITLTKEMGVDQITDATPPGDVVKYWHYETAYWKGLAEIQRTILEMYKSNAISLEKLKGDLNKMIDTTNKQLKDTPPPAQK